MLDIGCGTGIFALLLADRSHDVVGLEPARASLDLARAKPGAERVRWIDGDARALPSDVRVELATMTANVAQAIAGPEDWDSTLAAARHALDAGGHLVFETRVPSVRAWESWTRRDTYDTTDVSGVGAVTTWTDVLDVALPLVTFRSTYVFASDGTTLVSHSTLNFRAYDEITADLARHGFTVVEVRDAPDRPGRENGCSSPERSDRQRSRPCSVTDGGSTEPAARACRPPPAARGTR